MPATDAQVQIFVDTRIRPRCEQIRGLLAAVTDDINSIDDVYAALTEPNPTWADNRLDGPPHLMVPSDVIAINTALHTIRDTINGLPDLPIVEKACVRPIGT